MNKMNKKISINSAFSYILFSVLLALSASAFSVGLLDNFGLTAEQKLQAQSLAMRLNTSSLGDMGKIEEPMFNESLDKKEKIEEYKLSKIERLLNGESIEKGLIESKKLKHL